jgi:hypothetical protein
MNYNMTVGELLDHARQWAACKLYEGTLPENDPEEISRRECISRAEKALHEADLTINLDEKEHIILDLGSMWI